MNRRRKTRSAPTAESALPVSVLSGPALSGWGWVGCAIVALVCWTGCARWSPPLADSDRLPLPDLTPESVMLEVTFVRIPAENTQFADEFWHEVDEGLLANQLRRRLALNGFRCGLLGETLPANLQAVLDVQQETDPLKLMTDGQFGSDIIARTHQIRSQAGQSGKIVVRSGPVTTVAALTLDSEGDLHGETLEQTQFHLTFRTSPLGNGQVKLELTPAIEHGQPRSRYVGREGNWALDSGSRPVKKFESLRSEIVVTAGQAVALTCTTPARGLGAQFFAADTTAESPRLMLLVRIQQTQLDDRFFHREMAEPLAAGSE